MWFDPVALTKAQPEPLATSATPATLEQQERTAAAKVAEIAKVARPRDAVSTRQWDDETFVDALLGAELDAANNWPEDERIDRVIAKLEHDAGLRYAIEVHDDVEPDAVILTVAIRSKGACELRIPKTRYDAFALLDLIEQHTTRRTLQ